ncbi:MAG: cytochrome ubiquinol oxidase subunit I [Acidobacteriia bacterium]|nr:cytochrome ubiquinol oxidase subunit I [Terriglobia bacterium]
MSSAYILDRIQFAFTIAYHYLFPQLTMGLAPLIMVLQGIGVFRGSEKHRHAARFWARIFVLNFALGVVTGVPMEFQFGTNWSRFSQLTGGVLGQPLVMEGVFSFFLESAFLGLFLFGEKRIGPTLHWLSGVAVFIGSWLSGFFIITANAWMQHPVAYTRSPDGVFQVTSFWGVLSNPWALLQYAHTMSAAVITGSFVMAAVGAFYILSGRSQGYGRMFVRVGVIAGLISTGAQIFPTGDLQARHVALHQPSTTAAMEGLFKTQEGAPMLLLGQPDPQHMSIENPLPLNDVLSFIIYGTFRAEVTGLDAFPRENWPDNIPLLFFCYHIMAGLGTMFVALMVVCAFLMWRGKLYVNRIALWLLMLAVPFPYIANIAGWVTAEIGRQPWLVYGLVRTSEGFSRNVSSGSTWFTLLGYMGIYMVLGILFLFLLQRIIANGPEPAHAHAEEVVGISG